MGVLNLKDVYNEIQKDFAPEEQQESYDLCKEICNDLLSKGLIMDKITTNVSLRDELSIGICGGKYNGYFF
jgi:hypothetical protein